MVGGGVPKNFTQDIVVATDILGQQRPVHKYAIQLTVADERDGGLSGSTLKEACSWGKVDLKYEQMVFCEATIALPLIVSNAFHMETWKSTDNKGACPIFSAVRNAELHPIDSTSHPMNNTDMHPEKRSHAQRDKPVPGFSSSS